jgi:beta-glucosidase
LDARRRLDGLQNRWFLDPIFRGSYPADVVQDLSWISGMEHVLPGDLDVIAQPIDALCVNYYSSFCTKALSAPRRPAAGERPTPWVGTEDIELYDRGLPRTAMGWDIDPAGLTRVLLRLTTEYTSIPLYITENGAGGPDPVVHGEVEDGYRWEYIESHLAAIGDAIRRGAPVEGYFTWSLIDNFEWAWGFTQRFGLVHVDLETQQRTLKHSGRRFADFLRDSA